MTAQAAAPDIVSVGILKFDFGLLLAQVKYRLYRVSPPILLIMQHSMCPSSVPFYMQVWIRRALRGEGAVIYFPPVNTVRCLPLSKKHFYLFMGLVGCG